MALGSADLTPIVDRLLQGLGPSRRVLSDRTQEPPEAHGTGPVQIEPCYRSPTRRRTAHNLSEIDAPREVVVPAVATGMVERNGLELATRGRHQPQFAG